MSTNAILDEAEKRAGGATTHAHSTQAQVIEAMREEIGYPVYQRAKAQLPEIERAIRNTHRPFLDQVQTIAAKAKASVPTQMQGWLTEMATLCESIPRQVRMGIDGWDQLTPPIWKDGKSLDVSVRASLVHGIRVQLNSWDGCLSQLKNLTARVETFVQESGWPSMQPGSVPVER